MAVQKKFALGRGLDALISTEEVKTAGSSSINEIELSKISVNPNQPRREFDPVALQELADSIAEIGIIQPITLRQLSEDSYQIIAGERRYRASIQAGLKSIPAYIRTADDENVMEMALIENIQREDLNPVEEAMAYQRLIKEYDLKQDEVAERVSKSRTAITNSIRLLKLDERVQNMLIQESISSGHARALLAVKDGDEQYNLAMKIFDEKLSVRETEKLIKSLGKEKTAKPKKKELKNDFVYRDLEEKLKTVTGTKVMINRKTEKSGKIEIEYYNQEDLEKIIGFFK